MCKSEIRFVRYLGGLEEGVTVYYKDGELGHFRHNLDLSDMDYEDKQGHKGINFPTLFLKLNEEEVSKLVDISIKARLKLLCVGKERTSNSGSKKILFDWLLSLAPEEIFEKITVHDYDFKKMHHGISWYKRGENNVV